MGLGFVSVCVCFCGPRTEVKVNKNARRRRSKYSVILIENVCSIKNSLCRQTKLVFFLQDNAGDPALAGKPRWAYLSCSGSQSEHSIRFIFPPANSAIH